MKTKFDLGESVHCDFIGEVYQIKTVEGQIFYEIHAKTKIPWLTTMCISVPENSLCRLEKPEDFQDPNPDHERP